MEQKRVPLSDVLPLLANDVWPVQGRALKLVGSGEAPIDIWSWRIDVDSWRVKPESECLSADEQERMAQLRTPELRSRFQATRSRMRTILGAYVGIPGSDLRLRYGTHGKPSIAPADCPVPHFNLSHSDCLAALAVSWLRRVGIDIERVQPIEPFLSREVFSQLELSALDELPPGERLTAFYRCWTRKEAIVKGIGDGLSIPFDSFDVSFQPDRPAEVLRADGFRASDWQLVEFVPAPGYIGAVAIAAPTGLLR